MKYRNLGQAITGLIDQTRRGLTDHEYELHLQRLGKYSNMVYDLEDKVEVLSDEVGSERYIKAQRDLEKYKAKLDAELALGLDNKNIY